MFSSHLLSSRALKRVFQGLILVWLLAAVAMFWKFSVFCYGYYPLSADEVRGLRWRDTWDFIIHKP